LAIEEDVQMMPHDAATPGGIDIAQQAPPAPSADNEAPALGTLSLVSRDGTEQPPAASGSAKRQLGLEDEDDRGSSKSRALSRQQRSDVPTDTPQTPVRHGTMNPRTKTTAAGDHLPPPSFVISPDSVPALPQVRPPPAGVHNKSNPADPNNPFAGAAAEVISMQHHPDPLQDAKSVFTKLRSALALSSTPQEHAPAPKLGPHMSYTAVPLEGWPEVHLEHATRLFDGQDPAQAEEWATSDEDAAFASIFDFNSDNPEEISRTGQNLAVILRQLTDHDDLEVGIPIKKDTEYDINGQAVRAQWYDTAPLRTYLIYDTPKASLEALAQQRIWSFKEMTFEVRLVDRSFPHPSFIMSFAAAGFRKKDIAFVKEVVAEAWGKHKDIIFGEYTVKEHPGTMQQDVFHTTPDKLNAHLRTMLATLRLEKYEIGVATGVKEDIYNVYATIPVPDNHPNPGNLWFRVRNTMRHRIKYTTTRHGSATTQRPFTCTICGGIGHPRGLCPFPKIPGWNGPNDDKAKQEGKWGNQRNGGGASRGRGWTR
jgi:hypothetical protein